MDVTVITILNFVDPADQSDETVLELQQTVTEDQATPASSSLSLVQTIIDWNPIAIVRQTLDLASAGSGDTELEAIAQAYQCTNSRSPALGAIPSNHPGA